MTYRGMVDAKSKEPKKAMDQIFFMTHGSHKYKKLYSLFKAKNSSSIRVDYNQSMLLLDVICNNGIWGISIYKKGAALIMGQQHPSLVSSITVLFAYRYMWIFCCFIALCNDGSAIVVILVCKIVHVAYLQGSYFLVFCSYLIFILDSLYLVISFLKGLLIA